MASSASSKAEAFQLYFFLPCELCCMLFGYLFRWLQRKKYVRGGYSSVDFALLMQVPVWPAPTVLVDVRAGIFWRTLLHIDKEGWQQQVELLVCYSHGHAAVVQRCTSVLRSCTSVHWGLASTDIQHHHFPAPPVPPWGLLQHPCVLGPCGGGLLAIPEPAVSRHTVSQLGSQQAPR